MTNYASDMSKLVTKAIDGVDYVLGPEHPPSPIEIPYAPEPEYPEYLAPSDDEAPLEDQPLPADASPTAASPGYMTDSNPEEDPEEGPEEDPEEDPKEDPEEDPEDDQADYLTDEGDGEASPVIVYVGMKKGIRVLWVGEGR
nr:hypothetical protein [Tanacetum cinerariifolium]